jgi:thiol-disulfide isomerase/thioredoxin
MGRVTLFALVLGVLSWGPAMAQDAVTHAGTDGSAPSVAEVAETLDSIGFVRYSRAISAVDFTLVDLQGRQRSLDDYIGKLVLLNFWATWCPPCRREMPSMQALYEQFHDDGLEIVALNVLEDRSTAADFIEETGYTFPVLLDADGRTATTYAIRYFPTTYVIDRNGVVLGRREGFHDWSSPEVTSGFEVLLRAGSAAEGHGE